MFYVAINANSRERQQVFLSRMANFQTALTDDRFKLLKARQIKFSNRGYTPLCFVPPLVEDLLLPFVWYFPLPNVCLCGNIIFLNLNVNVTFLHEFYHWYQIAKKSAKFNAQGCQLKI